MGSLDTPISSEFGGVQLHDCAFEINKNEENFDIKAISAVRRIFQVLKRSDMYTHEELEEMIYYKEDTIRIVGKNGLLNIIHTLVLLQNIGHCPVDQYEYEDKFVFKFIVRQSPTI